MSKKVVYTIIGSMAMIVSGAIMFMGLFDLSQAHAYEEKREEQFAGAMGEEEMDTIFKNMRNYLEKIEYEGITVIDSSPIRLEKDHYGRYLGVVQVIGVNEERQIRAYDYYVILYKSHVDLIEGMPLGVELIETSAQVLKKDILESTLKVATGWGTPTTTKARGENESQYMEQIVLTAEVVDFVASYLQDSIEFIEGNEMIDMSKYYQEDSMWLDAHIKRMEQLNKDQVEVKLYNVYLKDISIEEEMYYARLVGTIYIHDDEHISVSTDEVSIPLFREGEKLVIVEQDVEIELKEY